MTQQITADDAFDEALDDATHMVLTRFETLERFDYITLPQGTQRTELLYRINDALTQIMGEYRK